MLFGRVWLKPRQNWTGSLFRGLTGLSRVLEFHTHLCPGNRGNRGVFQWHHSSSTMERYVLQQVANACSVRRFPGAPSSTIWGLLDGLIVYSGHHSPLSLSCFNAPWSMNSEHCVSSYLRMALCQLGFANVQRPAIAWFSMTESKIIWALLCWLMNGFVLNDF